MSSIQQPLTFLTLPSEIRLIVYRYLAQETLITVEHISSEDVTEHESNTDQANRFWPYTINSQGLDIVATCKQVYREAAPVLLPITTVRLPLGAMSHHAVPHKRLGAIMFHQICNLHVPYKYEFYQSSDEPLVVYGDKASSAIQLFSSPVETTLGAGYMTFLNKLVNFRMPTTLDGSLLEEAARYQIAYNPEHRNTSLDIQRLPPLGGSHAAMMVAKLLRKAFPSSKVTLVLHCYIQWSGIRRDVVLLEAFYDVASGKLVDNKVWDEATGEELFTPAAFKSLLEVAGKGPSTEVTCEKFLSQEWRSPGKRY